MGGSAWQESDQWYLHRWLLAKRSLIGGAIFMLVIDSQARSFVGTLTGHNRAPLIVGALIGIYLLFSIKVADPWEKVAVLRRGRYIGLRGPGLFHVVPVVDRLSQRVDQRVRVASVMAESTLTRDTVPVNVDAIVFWIVWNVEKSILEVEDFVQAINMSAQTALRESIGRHELAQLITEREMMGRELQRILDEKTNPWGITVQSVDQFLVATCAKFLQGLEDRENVARRNAEREQQTRILQLGQAETDIAQKFSEAWRLMYVKNVGRTALARDEQRSAETTWRRARW